MHLVSDCIRAIHFTALHQAFTQNLPVYFWITRQKKNQQPSYHQLPLLSQMLVIKLLLCMLIVISSNRKLLLISIYAMSAVTSGRIGSGKIHSASKQTAGREVGRSPREMFAPQWLLGILNIYTGSFISQRYM